MAPADADEDPSGLAFTGSVVARLFFPMLLSMAIGSLMLLLSRRFRSQGEPSS